MNQNYAPFFSGVMALSILAGCSVQALAAPNAGYPEAAALVSGIRTTQYYTDEPVSSEALNQILTAGINAPSSMNSQPWHFSVITDKAVLEEIAGGMSFGGMPSGDFGEMPSADFGQMPEGMNFPGAPEGTEMPAAPNGDAPEMPAKGEMPAAPASSGKTKAGLTDVPLAIVISCKEGSELDAGLACQNMSVAAQLLGYGTKIISSPTIALNGSRQEEFSAMLGIPEGQKAVAVLLIGVEDTSVDTTADSYTGATERNPVSEMVTYVKP